MWLTRLTFAVGMMAGGMLFVPAAYACESEIMTPSNRIIRLDNCAARIQHGETSAAALSEAKNLGSGFVLQVMTDGEACSGNEMDQVIQDCNSGRVAVFGEDYGTFWIIDPNAPPIASDVLLEKVMAASAKGKPMSIDEILAKATKAGIAYQLEADTRSTLAINGHKFRLGCGCKTFYPDLPGAGG